MQYDNKHDQRLMKNQKTDERNICIKEQVTKYEYWYQQKAWYYRQTLV